MPSAMCNSGDNHEAMLGCSLLRFCKMLPMPASESRTSSFKGSKPTPLYFLFLSCSLVSKAKKSILAGLSFRFLVIGSTGKLKRLLI